MKTVNRAIAAGAVSLASLLLGCGGDAALLAGDVETGLSAPILQQVGGKTTSGAPIGIFLSWNRITHPSAIGYYIYRDTASIPDPPPEGDIDPLLRVNGGVMLDNPAEGDTVIFNDIFAIVVGTEYFYRVTVVDDQVPPQESPPSNELSWVAHGQSISGFFPTATYWGRNVTISGDTFGVYDEAIDRVLFTRFGGSVVEGEVQSWDDTEIIATVPVNADTGVLQLVIGATIAQSDEPLTILNPLIDELDSNPGYVGQPLALIGRNFKPAEASTMQFFLNGENLTHAVTAWDNTTITFDVPEDSTGGELYINVNGNDSNRINFSTRAEILSAYPLAVQSGELVTLYGRFFGLEGRALLGGTEELIVDSWSRVEVVVEVVGDPGPVTLSLETFSGITSNDLDYVISPDLAVGIAGLDPITVYTQDNAPIIEVVTPADVDRVELYVGGVLIGQSNTVPFGDLVLPVSSLVNGIHPVQLKAFRRAIIAESEIVQATVHSLFGDIDANGVVDNADRLALVPLLGLTSADEAYFPWYDSNMDNVVDELDLALVGYNFGNTITP